MSETVVDRWGSPVFASGHDPVVLLERAAEDLVALSGEPMRWPTPRRPTPNSSWLASCRRTWRCTRRADSGIRDARNLVLGLDAWDMKCR